MHYSDQQSQQIQSSVETLLVSPKKREGGRGGEGVGEALCKVPKGEGATDVINALTASGHLTEWF